jgi:hypothetical protein
MVAFPATHNSMGASTEHGWLFPSQDGGIAAQLSAGIRGFLIDTHYGAAAQRGVATILTPQTRKLATVVDKVGPGVITLADRLRASAGFRPTGERQVFPCHGLLRGRRDVRAGRARPDPGLRRRAPRPGHRAQHRRRRIVEALAAPSSCRPNRGGTDKSLFLLNNWVDTSPSPRPSNASAVNAYEALLARARRCEAERHRLPNLIAVDFYKLGDVLRVADTLNGV